MRIASFNMQNLRLRGTETGPRLQGARDDDTPESDEPTLARRDRTLAAQVIRDLRADVLALQEVFDRATLDHFHDRYLLPLGVPPYPHRSCFPGNDGRGLDLALLSRTAPRAVVSHAALRPADLGLAQMPGARPDQPIFRRDCLRVELGPLTLFVVHFKAPYPDAARTAPIRALEATAVRRLIEGRFPDPARAMWLVLGDLNDPWDEAGAKATAPLRAPFSVDLLGRLPLAQRWSHHDAWAHRYGHPNAMLASPALAGALPDAAPVILREGLGLEARRHTGTHLADVGHHRPHASDHAALVIDFPAL